MDDIYNRFRNFVLANNLIVPGDKILLSLSAGKDSMFMLHLVQKLQKEIDFKFGVFHLNHLTRGDDSDKDEFFVREICETINVPFHAERFDFKNNGLPGVSFEEHARNIRYSMLNKIACAEKYSKIATAHSMSDNAETLLMRILSGTGIAGLKGILPVINNIIRPVLFAGKDEIYSYLKNNFIKWREDISNTDNHYLRNYIRNNIMTLIAERFPDAEENLNKLAVHAVENQFLVENLADSLYPGTVIQNGYETVIDTSRFRDEIPLIKHFLASVLNNYFGIKIKISIFNEIIKRYRINSANMVLYQNGNVIIKKSLLNNHCVITVSGRNVNNEKAVEWEYTVSAEGDNITVKEIGKKLKVSYVSYNYYIANSSCSDAVFIQPEEEIKSLIIRNRRPGDRILIEIGTKKIKELMIEKKLDSKIKNTIPLIVADEYIAAYLPGLVNTNNNRIACNFHIRDDTKRILAFFFSDY